VYSCFIRTLVCLNRGAAVSLKGTAYGRECGIVQAPPELQRFGITAMYGGPFSLSVAQIIFY
jgi:hypothetical protein